MASSLPPARFESTHWSMVENAADVDAPSQRSAMEAFCGTYWSPVYFFLRRRGLGAWEAEDVTQEFFAELVRRPRLLETADQSQGKFRTYLLAAVKHHLANHRRREDAKKRGGGTCTLSVDWADAERQYTGEPIDGMTAEAIFHRRWALALLDRVLNLLERNYRDADRQEWFTQLRPYLTVQTRPPYADLAARLETTASAVRVAVHRLRKQYREALSAELRSTLEPGCDPEQERAELLRALGGTR